MSRLLAITGGHSVPEAAFADLLGAVAHRLGWTWEWARHPEAQAMLDPCHAGDYAAIVLYDLPGLGLARGTEPEPRTPDDAVCAGIRGLVDAGQGIVALHHALAGWPAWDGYADLLGGRFLYRPGSLRGAPVPPSGYRMDTYRVRVADGGHPVCAGVTDFDVTDELYGCPVFADRVQPLLTTDAVVGAASLIDSYVEVRDGVQQPSTGLDGRPLLGWVAHESPARVVYLLPGHGPSTMEHPMYRRLVENACRWVAGDE